MSSAFSNVAAIGLLSLLVSACGEVYQSVQMGPWRPAGSALAPKGQSPESSLRPKFQLTILEAGQGPQIGLGSLVHASITGEVIPSPHEPPGRYFKKIDDVWFWVGTADVYDADLPVLGLGTPDLRAAFIGARGGSRLSLVLDPVQVGNELRLPTQGVLLNFTKKYRYTAGFDSEYVQFTKVGRYEFKILDVCQGALLQKRAVLKQWGYIPHSWYGSPDYPFAREGVLAWAAIEADCENPKQKMRLEKGPAYRPASHLRPSGTLDNSWPESYERAVSKGRISIME